jgi:hypothetical protein
MGNKASRRGAANLGVPLMIVAFLAMLGFLYWLNVQAQKEEAAKQAAIAEQQAEDQADDDAGVERISGTSLQGDISGFVGATIRVDSLSVASGLGSQGFWLELPNKNPFLVSMSEAVKADGTTVSPGQQVSVVGTVHEMSDSVLDAWSNSGAIGEGDRLAAEFATHYIEATRVRTLKGSSGGGDGQGSGNGSGGGEG